MPASETTALITGASSGIGLELARVFAANGFDLVIVARRRAKLNALKKELESEYGVSVTVLARDLSTPNAAKGVFNALQEREIDVDVLVNNAGLAIVEPFHAIEFDSLSKLVQVNVVALTQLTKLFVEPMVERGDGRILNVASVVSFYPTPKLAAYGASKAFVLSLSEALSEELRGTGVTVTALCPGYTETDMIEGAIDGTELDSWDHLIPSVWKMSAAKVAEQGFRACMAGQAVHVTGLPYRVATEYVRHQPKWFVRRAGGILSKLLG
jgi:short-subunit dehydrogenase